MRVCFVVNPAAGRGKARRTWQALEPLVSGLGQYGVKFTGAPRHATDLARLAVEEGYDRVAVVGGDGTVSEVANALVGTHVAMAVVSTGTGNDYIRTLGIPKDAAAAARLAFAGAARPVDVGRVNGQVYFANIAGIGFDAEVAKAFNQAWYKKLGGVVGNLVGVFHKLFTYESPPMELCLDDGLRLQRRVLLVAAGIARYYGGGMMILPSATVDDGQFEVVVGAGLTRLEIMGVLPRIFSGKHVGHPKIEFFRCRKLTVTCQRPVAYHLDGDVAGALPVTFELVPGALQVVAPPDAPGFAPPPAGPAPFIATG